MDTLNGAIWGYGSVVSIVPVGREPGTVIAASRPGDTTSTGDRRKSRLTNLKHKVIASFSRASTRIQLAHT